MSNNRIILEGCISQYKSENQLESIDSEIFELFTLSQITKKDDISFESIQNSIVDGSQDGGIDSVVLIVNDEVIESEDDLSEIEFSGKTISKFIISQCKKENSFKEATLDKLITSCTILFDLEKNDSALVTRFNSGLVEKILILRSAWLKTSINGGRIKIDFNYCCNATTVTINHAFQSKVDQLKDLTNHAFSGAEVIMENYSCEELLKLYQTRKTTRISLPYKDQPLSTSYGESGIGYVGTVKLADYKVFLTDAEGQIREHLFESNVRHFQGQVDVNRKIQDTIAEDRSRDFWWLNNGITIIAENPNQIGKLLSVENVQIVNGLQTSYSIFNNHDEDKTDERAVLVKVIINNDNETVDKIIASTNSQNQVSPALLRATEETQRKIELFFLNKGYYYDRRKNYYKNIGKPVSKIFSIQLAAQSIETIAFDSPYAARAKPTSLVKEDSTYERIFNPNRSFNSYLNCCLIFKTTHDYWVNISDPSKKSYSTNFKLHLARISSSIVIGKPKYTFDDLDMMNILDYDQDAFDLSLTILLETLQSFQERNPDKNLINLAKSKPFTTDLLNVLNDSFQQGTAS